MARAPESGQTALSTAYVSSRPLGLVDDLSNNAVKYGPADRPIDVSVEGNADAVRVRILDRGPGIPDGEHETIFQLSTGRPQPRRSKESASA